MDDALIRRHSSAVRALVMDIIADNQPISADSIAAEWASRHPDLSPRHRSAVPRMSRQILWRLENLEWVVCTDTGYRLTALGARARKVGLHDH